jgi:hypothetical protein
MHPAQSAVDALAADPASVFKAEVYADGLSKLPQRLAVAKAARKARPTDGDLKPIDLSIPVGCGVESTRLEDVMFRLRKSAWTFKVNPSNHAL